jgi:uncharacterized protein
MPVDLVAVRAAATLRAEGVMIWRWLVLGSGLLCGGLFPALQARSAVPAEKIVHLPGPHGPLGGVLQPAGAHAAPVVLVIPDGGPTDHDGNNLRGLRAGTYRLLAAELADAGITSLRIDKRGFYLSAAAIADPDAVTVEDYATDARAWLRDLQRHTGARCVWLLGHGEGALVALIAAQQPSQLCGLVLVAAAGRPLGEVLRAQLARQSPNAPLSHPVVAAINALEAGRHVDAASLPKPLLALFRPRVQGFLISAFAYDPVQLLHAYPGPVLVLQGGRDLVVDEADARRLAQASAHTRLVVLPEVNHVLKAVSSAERSSNLATYAQAGLALAPGVTSAIVDFIRTGPADDSAARGGR